MKLRGASALAALCLASAAVPVSAQETRAGLSATDLFAAAEDAKIANRSADALALYDALTQDPDAEIRAEARFRKGMLLASEKHYADAAVVFRALLDEK